MTRETPKLTARRTHPRLLAAAAAIGAALALALPAVGAGPAAAASPGSGGATLRVEADTSVSTFNPFLAYYNTELDVLGSIYPSLTRFDQRGRPVPYLATSWRTSPDKLTWTFKIRSGLKWSDGVPITARDAAWTLNLIMKNPTAATANGSLVSDFASVTAPDATTLVIKTKKPQANMLYVSVPASGIPIVPEHVWAKEVPHLGKFQNMHFPVVGYGPWKLTGFLPNQYTTLKANKSFYLGAPKYDTLIVQYFANTDAAVAALRSGQLDETELTATEYQALRGKQHIGLYPTASAGWHAIELNPGARTRSGKFFGNGNPLLRDQRVREAIAMAINRKVLVTKVLDGLGVAGAGYIPPGYPQWAWQPAGGGAFGYNPARANKLLDSAGFKRGAGGIRTAPKTGKPLSFRLGIHSDDITDSQVAPYLQEWLKAIGIKLTVQSMSFNELNTMLPKGDWDILMDAWTTSPDPTYLLSIQTCGTLPRSNGNGGNTDAFYCNPRFDRLFKQQVGEFSQPQRARTIGQMQQILYDANVDVVLYYPDLLNGIRTDKVSGFFYGKPNGQGFYPLQNNFISWQSAAPVASSGGGSSATTAWIVIAVVVVLAAAGAGWALRRRATAGERE
jgi:peptide/nickel transport system substrate-binding protein